MEEIKKYKLCPDSTVIKEPKKIRLAPLESTSDEETTNKFDKYDIYCPDSEEIYSPSDLKNNK
jgi:hypothetical protein